MIPRPTVLLLLLLACLLLAPIAGDVAAQLVYKAPFALLLIAGTALLAASCDRLRPRAGRYPWLAVAGIYAVPVAWNLVVIAGHTGFHVVPAVVYAPVAVVCAVGVWRAARPRPEALSDMNVISGGGR